MQRSVPILFCPFPPWKPDTGVPDLESPYPPRLSVINFQVYSFLPEKLSAVKLNLFLLFSHFLAGFHLRNIVYYEAQMKGFLNLFLIILIHSIASAQPADPLAFNLSDCSRISVPYRLCSTGLSYRNVTYLADMDNAGKHEFVFKPPESIGIKSG